MINMTDVITQLKDAQINSKFRASRVVTDKNWFNWKYWRYRILRPLIKMRYAAFRKKHYPSPWLTPASILFFDAWLTTEKVGAEFGSGISTLFFAKRSKHVVSIEHYQPWYDKVVDLFKEEGRTNITYKFVPKEASMDTVIKDSSIFGKYNFFELEKTIRWDYQAYFQALSEYDDAYFDYILVDGRARPECLVHALDKLKSNGLMILDNSERARYDSVFQLLEEWPTFTTSNGLTNTTFWIKP